MPAPADTGLQADERRGRLSDDGRRDAAARRSPDRHRRRGNVAIDHALRERRLHAASPRPRQSRACIADGALALELGARIEKHELTLCSAGGYTLDTVVEQDGVIETVAEAGTWTLRADGAQALLELQTPASSRMFAVTLDAGGATLLDGATAQLTDGRATCEPAPQAPQASLEDQLETALGGTAFFFVETSSVGGIPLRVKIGFCASGRHIVQTTNARRGPWDVRVENGTPVLELADDAGSVFRTFAIGFDTNGPVLLDGQHAPVDEPSVVEAACQ